MNHGELYSGEMGYLAHNEFDGPRKETWVTLRIEAPSLKQEL